MPVVGVAMSGGVDSSAAAVLLQKKGYRVFGVSMRLFEPRTYGASKYGSCCSPEDIQTAKRAARVLGIPHYTIDLTGPFNRTVVRNFVGQYMAGRTPNPCIVCNKVVKFDILLKKIRGMGADHLATGHYITKKKTRGKFVLEKGKDRNKDQSYFLYDLSQDVLKHLLFPAGRYTKEEIRAIARTHCLPNADKEESQEICFVEDNDYAGFLKTHSAGSVRPGPVNDAEGRRIGTHRGFPYYTVGQRKGLALTVRGPKFVLRIDPAKNLIIAGDRADTYSRELTAEGVSWVSGGPPRERRGLRAQIRYRHTPSPAVIRILPGGKVCVRFAEPQHAVTPGQAVVFYKGRRMLGGGTIL